MAELRDDALLLRRVPYSDTSLICHFLTHQHGRVSLMARGARRAKSPFRAALAPLYRLQISWRPGRTGMGTLTDAVRGERLLDERMDLEGLELCSVAAGLFQEGDPHGYGELVEALTLMQHSSFEAALYTGLWHLLQRGGWVGDFRHCWQCGNEVDDSAAMGWRDAELICSSCGSDAMVTAGMRKGFTAQFDRANVRLGRHDIACWQRMIQDVLRQHGLRALSTVTQG